MADFSIPVPDRDSAPYWAALSEGRLEVQQCQDCGHWTWPARPVCPKCLSENLAWKPVKGTGEVHSWVVAHRPFVPRLEDEVPYTIALVRLDEEDDVLIPARMVDGTGVHQGMRVRAIADSVADDVGELTWEQTSSNGG